MNSYSSSLGRMPLDQQQLSSVNSLAFPRIEKVLPAPVCPQAKMQQLKPYIQHFAYFEALLEYRLPDGIVDFLLLTIFGSYMVKREELFLILCFHNDGVNFCRRQENTSAVVFICRLLGSWLDSYYNFDAFLVGRSSFLRLHQLPQQLKYIVFENQSVQLRHRHHHRYSTIKALKHLIFGWFSPAYPYFVSAQLEILHTYTNVV